MIEKWRDDKTRLRDDGELLPARRVNLTQYIGLLSNFSRILLALEWLSDTKLGDFDATGWERAFIDHGARFELLTELVVKNLQDLNMIDPISIKALRKERDWFLSQFQKGFSEYIGQEYKSLIASPSPVNIFSEAPTNAESGPRFVHSIRYHFYEKYRKKLKPAETHFLLIDGMRWDIWDYCQHDLIKALHDTYRTVDQVPLWVFLPSTTSSQIGPFVTGEPPSPYINMTKEKETSPAGIMEKRLSYTSGQGKEGGRFFELIPEKDGIITYKYNFIDDKLHTSGEDLLTVFSEIKLHLQSSLTEYMNKLPVKSMVILFSDHGFIKKKPYLKRDRKTSLYSHGGNSPWEMIVPLVVLYKWR